VECQARFAGRIVDSVAPCTRCTPTRRCGLCSDSVYTATRRREASHRRRTRTCDSCWWACISDRPTATDVSSYCLLERRRSTRYRLGLTPATAARATVGDKLVVSKLIFYSLACNTL